jgi:hypothetical protein
MILLLACPLPAGIPPFVTPLPLMLLKTVLVVLHDKVRVD